MRSFCKSKPPCSSARSFLARDLSSWSSSNRCSMPKRYIPSCPPAGKAGGPAFSPSRVHSTWAPLRRTRQLVPLLSNSASRDSAGGSPFCSCSRWAKARTKLLLPLALGPVTMLTPTPSGLNSKPGSMPGRALICRRVKCISGCPPLAPTAYPRRGSRTFAAMQWVLKLFYPICSSGVYWLAPATSA